jgi:hypothetical protein
MEMSGQLNAAGALHSDKTRETYKENYSHVLDLLNLHLVVTDRFG